MINVRVDVTNPGQFFACCGLFELANRLFPGCRAAFTEDGRFQIVSKLAAESFTLDKLITTVHASGLIALDRQDPKRTPLQIPSPFNLRLDWWNDSSSGGESQKTWAGNQKVVNIALALHARLLHEVVEGEAMLSCQSLLWRIDKPRKPIEGFYFDSVRGSQGTARDVGFSPDTQKLRSAVSATTELLCLVGLQRFRPRPMSDESNHYCVWPGCLTLLPASAVVPCVVHVPGIRRFAFRITSRSDSKDAYHSFSTATPQGVSR
jgi:hypothetical protein